MKTMLWVMVALVAMVGCSEDVDGGGCDRPVGPPEEAALCNTGPGCAACYSDGAAARYYVADGCGWAALGVDLDNPSAADIERVAACDDQFDTIWEVP